MAQQIVPYDPKQGGSRRRDRARQLTRAAVAAAPAGWFQPERRYLTQRGPQIAALAAGLKQVRAIVNAEKNFFDVASNIAIPIVPTAIPLTIMPIGDDVQMRTGRTIKLKGFSLGLDMSSGATATVPMFVRVLVVKDSFAQGAAPTIGQVIQNTSSPTNVLSPMLLSAQQTRFKVIVDDIVALAAAPAGSSSGGSSVHREYSADLQHHVEYIGTTGTVADAGSGQLWLYLFCDTNTSNAAGCAYYSRIRYYDN